jgi:hypothetical protein
MFFRREPVPVSSEVIERLSDIEARLKRLERRWAARDPRGIEAALASLCEAGGFEMPRDATRSGISPSPPER